MTETILWRGQTITPEAARRLRDHYGRAPVLASLAWPDAPRLAEELDRALSNERQDQ